MNSHKEIIKCCECNKVQVAEVLHTFPWATFIHHCSGCGYIIMESEWDRPVFKKQAVRILIELWNVKLGIRSFCRTTKKAEIKKLLMDQGINVEIKWPSKKRQKKSSVNV
jgi:ribosomal protein S27E